MSYDGLRQDHKQFALRPFPEAHLRHNIDSSRPSSAGQRAYPIGDPRRPYRRGLTVRERILRLEEILDYMDAERAPRYAPDGPKTWCNIYAADFCYLAGVYLPRVWWNEAALEDMDLGMMPTAMYASTVREMRANDLHDWLVSFGWAFGWQRSTPQSAQQVANAGGLGAIVAKNYGSKPGHISMVVPETFEAQPFGPAQHYLPVQSQAGRIPHKRSAGRAAWWLNQRFESWGVWSHS